MIQLLAYTLIGLVASLVALLVIARLMLTAGGRALRPEDRP